MYGVLLMTVFWDLIWAVLVGVFIANMLTIDSITETQLEGMDEDNPLSKDDNEVRNNFKSNTNVVLKEGGNCIHGAPCWYFNFGLACPHAPLCMNEGLMHIALSHFCLKCGKQDDINKGKEHALVECPQFRATWMPRAIGNDWSTRVYSRPVMAELIKKAAESKRARENRNRGNNRNGRGDGNGRNGRGNGKNGRSNGGNNNGTGNNNNGNPSQSQTPNGKTQNGAKDKKTTKKDNSS